MLKTSIGIHTITIFMKVTEDDYNLLLDEFMKYEKTTKKIKIYPNNKNKTSHTVKYNNRYKGIKWSIYHWCTYEDKHGVMDIYSVEATINPKILSGITDYITAANHDDYMMAMRKYIEEANKISPLLGTQKYYQIKRVDFCANFYVPELDIKCSSEQLMELFKRGNIPFHYEEYKEYDYEKSHRWKSPKDSFYLNSKSVTINIYDKQAQLEKEYPDNPCIEESEGIFRFEVQFKYSKVYNLSRKCTNNDKEASQFLLSDDFAKEIINSYYKRTIRFGDYYTLPDAITIVSKKCTRNSKKDRLVKTLRLISKSHGISKAKAKIHQNESLEGELLQRELTAFNQALRELSEMGINPVTIPRDWGISYIPNPLQKYYAVSGGKPDINPWDYEAKRLLVERLSKEE